MQAAEWISFIAQFARLNRRQRQAGMALGFEKFEELVADFR